jgi:hypothetical protein
LWYIHHHKEIFTLLLCLLDHVWARFIGLAWLQHLAHNVTVVAAVVVVLPGAVGMVAEYSQQDICYITTFST